MVERTSVILRYLVSMVMDAIRDCSHRQAIALDAFARGTTLIAAERTARRGYDIEAWRRRRAEISAPTPAALNSKLRPSGVFPMTPSCTFGFGRAG